MRSILIGLTALTLAACGGPPKRALTEAEVALNGAILAKKCAPEDYAAAERMYAKAQKLADEEKYDEAEEAALAAKKLAITARDKALANKDECLKPKAEKTGVDVNDFIDPTGTTEAVGIETEGLQTVYFDFNAYDLTPEAKNTMARNAAWLRAHPAAKVNVEGHADERGSTEYNLALAERRAFVARRYLRDMGVDVSRLSVLSYGEEQPEDYGNTESAYARNRRVAFSVRSLE